MEESIVHRNMMDGREVSNSLPSCGLSETLLFYVYVNCAIANLIDISGLSISCSKIVKCRLEFAHSFQNVVRHVFIIIL